MARLAAAVAAIGALVVLFVSFASARSGAAGDPALVQIGTFSAPIYVTAPPGDGARVFVVEKGGRIRVVKNGATLGTPFLDLTGPVRSTEYERGLLSMAFAPDYPTTGLFYVYYTADSPLGALTIAEYRRSAGDPDVADPASGRIVLSIDHPGQENHNGGQLQFGPGRLPLRRDRRRGRGERPDQQRPEPERPPRQAPPHRPAFLGGFSVHDSRVEPLRRRRRQARGDLVLRASEPVALLVRPADGRPDDRGRGAERLGGDQFRDGRVGRWTRTELRVEMLRGQAHLQQQPTALLAAAAADAARARVRQRPGRARLLDHRRLRRPRSVAAGTHRAVRLRRRCLRQQDLVASAAERRNRRADRPGRVRCVLLR